AIAGDSLVLSLCAVCPVISDGAVAKEGAVADGDLCAGLDKEGSAIGAQATDKGQVQEHQISAALDSEEPEAVRATGVDDGVLSSAVERNGVGNADGVGESEAGTREGNDTA